MGRWVATLIVAGYVTLQGSVEAFPSQAPQEKSASGEQESVDKNRPSEPPPPAQSASVTTSSQYPLDRFQNFSAIQNGGPLPGMEEDRYIYRSGNLMRMQGDAAVPEYYITDLATQKSHAVSGNGCLQMGYPYKGSFPFFVSRPGVTYEHLPSGEEIVDGHKCHVEDLTIHSPKNPVVLHFRLYEADDLQGFPIKIENRRENAYRWVIHYKEVRLGPPDPSLFMIPDKCQTMAGFKKTGPSPKAAPPAKSH